MKILVTGCSGLIGSEAVDYFGRAGHTVLGIDNNQRRAFFGKGGDTIWNLNRLLALGLDFSHLDADIRDRERILRIYEKERPDATVHCAAQPSHDLSAKLPFDDFDVNAGGTLNLLEASRRYTLESPFVLMSTNKVYGDAPNELELVEKESRWDYADPTFYHGIPESMRIDQSTHSLFGATKAAADLMTQEYGRNFGLPAGCFRGGCLTGPNHSGVELHGFVSYLVKCAVQKKHYTIYGYKGKQVRDQLHSRDVIRAMDAFIQAPRPGEVYNLGGGRDNSVSVLECIDRIHRLSGIELHYSLDELNRVGDHICYISDLRKMKTHYPDWSVSVDLDTMIGDMIEAERSQG